MAYFDATGAAKLLAAIATAGLTNNTDNVAVSNAMNVPAVISNGSAPQVPVPINFGNLVSVLSPASLTTLMNSPTFALALSSANSQDYAAVGNYVGAWYKATWVTTSEYNAMVAMLTATEDDPHFVPSHNGPSPFVVAMGSFEANVNGSCTVGICHPEFIAEVRGQ